MANENLINFLKKGSEIAGGAIGGAIGLIGGPVGAVAGGGLGVLSAQLMNEVIERSLSQREKVRIAATSTYIFDGIGRRLDEGQTIRTDGFFNAEEHTRSDAEELFEGTLLKCAEQYQEKKIKYISHIFEETIFDDTISPETANQFLILSQSLSYRKFCILAYYGQKATTFADQVIMRDPYLHYPHVEFSYQEKLLIQDLFELVSLGLFDTSNHLFTFNTHVIPDKISLSEIGAAFYNVFDLRSIPVEDIQPIIEDLKYKETWGRSSIGTINGERPV